MVDVPKRLSLTAAAKKVGIDRETLMKRIREKEDEIGEPIIVRGRSGSKYFITEAALLAVVQQDCVSVAMFQRELDGVKNDVALLKRMMLALLRDPNQSSAESALVRAQR